MLDDPAVTYWQYSRLLHQPVYSTLGEVPVSVYLDAAFLDRAVAAVGVVLE